MNKRLSKILIISWCVVCGTFGLFLALCTLLSAFMIFEMHSGTMEELKSDDLYILGTLNTFQHNYRYAQVEIGNRDNPVPLKTKFSLEMKNGERIRSDEITLNRILELKPKYTETNSNGMCSCELEDGLFVFAGQHLVFFECSTLAKSSIIKIGDYQMKNFFELPLTKEQCKILFGEPAQVERRSSW